MDCLLLGRGRGSDRWSCSLFRGHWPRAAILDARAPSCSRQGSRPASDEGNRPRPTRRPRKASDEVVLRAGAGRDKSAAGPPPRPGASPAPVPGSRARDRGTASRGRAPAGQVAHRRSALAHPTPSGGGRFRHAHRTAGSRRQEPHYLHAENHRFAHDDHYLDPLRPEALIYANVPGHALLLIGVMFSMPRGIHGPTPGGPITRWHFHLVCAHGNLRGLKPLANGTCPPRDTLREGSEMLHVWFTDDLRSAFAIHAPEPELCAAHLLPADYCSSGRYLRGM